MPLIASLSNGAQRTFVTAASCLVIAGALAFIFLRQRDPSSRAAEQTYVGIGEAAAEQTALLLQNRGEVVVVSGNINPFIDAQFDAFSKKLKQSGAVRIAVHEKIRLAIDGVVGEEFTGSDLIELVRKNETADAIVSFLGIPGMNFSQLPEQRPKLISVLGYDRDLKVLLQRNIVQLAIVPRFQPLPATTPKPNTPQEWFDQYYQVVTPADAPELPE